MIVFGLTRPGLEPTIYRTRGEHANDYATDAVCRLKTITSRTKVQNIYMKNYTEMRVRLDRRVNDLRL
jgi:hypothetical protein